MQHGLKFWARATCLLATICLGSGCIRTYEVVEDPGVIVQLAEPVTALVWIPLDGELVKVVRTLPKGKLVVDWRHPSVLEASRERGD